MDKYDSYKASGEKWLGEIPSHWNLLPIKYILRERKEIVGKNSSQYQLLSLTLRGIIERDMENPEGKFPASFDTYQKVYKGDFVFCNFDNEETPRAVGLSRFNGMITGAYDVLYKENKGLDSNFLNYYFLYIDDGKRFKPLYKGLRKTVPFDAFMSYKLPVLPLPEQRGIASYLDSATSKIDAAIGREQKMIDLLNERKQIIINQAVTKGLDPNARMKDSGVEWIGAIPEGWQVKRLGVLGTFSKGGNISRDDLTLQGKNAILYGDIYTKYNIKAEEICHHVPEKIAGNSVRINKNDILMTGSGETKEDIGKTIVFLGDEAYIGGDVILFRQNVNSSLFLSYALNSQYAKIFKYKQSKGEIVVHIYPYNLRGLYLAIPPINEQKSIAEFLDEKISVIDKTI